MSFDNNKLHEIKILNYVEITSHLNNRIAAAKIGCSVRLAHELLKKMTEYGWLRIEKVHTRRWDYFLTEQGRHHKDKLTTELWEHSRYFYQEVRKLGSRLGKQLKEQRFHKIALIGAGEIAEIVYLGLKEHDLELTGVFSELGTTFPGVTVQALGELNEQAAEAFIYCGAMEARVFLKKNLHCGMSFPQETYTVLGEKINF